METMDLLEKDNLELNQKYNETELQLKYKMKELERVLL